MFRIVLLFILALGATAQAETAKPNTQVEKEKPFVLWGLSFSPYVRYVLTVLNTLKLPYEHKAILPSALLKATGEEPPKEFEEISKKGKIPALEDKKMGTSMVESWDIADNLIQNYGQSSTLIPKCKLAKSRMRGYIEYAKAVIAPMTHQIAVEKYVKPNILKQDADQQIIERNLQIVQNIFDVLEHILTPRKSGEPINYIADTKNPSLADMAVVSHIVTLKTVGYDLDKLTKDRPNLQKYLKRILDLPAFQEAMAAK